MSRRSAERSREERESAEELTRVLDQAIPADTSGDPERWRVHQLLTHLVSFHRREDKPYWWAVYERRAMSEDELADDVECLAGIERTRKKPVPEKRSLLFEYRFDLEQETKLREGSKWRASHDQELKGTIHAFDPDAGRLTLKTTAPALPERFSLVPDDHVDPGVIAASILRIARRWAESQELTPALRALLFRERPRLARRRAGAPIIDDAGDLKAESIRAVSAMEATTLAIQGPPGSGKTHVGAQVIAHLIQQGHRVGITSHGHKAIDHLMAETLRAARALHLLVRATKVVRESEAPLFSEPEVTHAQGIAFVSFSGRTAPQLVGGTAWAFSAPVAEGQLDYLFVDEAGQVSLANLVAMAPSARNLVLLGDQMQLPQPLQGTHPGESGTSALEYLLTDGARVHATIPPELGIFLPTTHRLHPAICRFISDAIYEGRLEPEPYTKDRVVLLGTGKPGHVPIEAGLHFVPVEHEGNLQYSDEEVEAIRAIVSELRKRLFREKAGACARPVRDSDMLVVAPYNLQVNRLRAALPELSIGTVDRFQGQQAPIVIISMCSSSADDAPRGLEFLLSRNRLNVAISRAQSLAILVGHPALARTRVTSVAQMRLVNLFCRIHQAC